MSDTNTNTDKDVGTGNGPDPQQQDTRQPEASAEQPQVARSENEADAVAEAVAESQQLLQEANNRALRAQAELENYRKRARRELDEQRRYAAIPLIAELLPVLDNLDRAVEAAEQGGEGGEGGGLLAGVKMVRTQLLGVLERFECQQIQAEGTPFDPNQHEAIGQEPSDEAPGIVTRVARSGYKVHDRVVRPSQVMISSGSGDETEEE